MKAFVAACVFLLAGVLPLCAQDHGLEAARPDTSSPAMSAASQRLRGSMEAQDVKKAESGGFFKKGFSFGGPVVRIFKGKSLREAPRRFFHLINPFAKSEPGPDYANSRELSPRAWSSVVGWRNGASAFPDATTHESSLGLISTQR
jgi:hypothetical protein